MATGADTWNIGGSLFANQAALVLALGGAPLGYLNPKNGAVVAERD